MVQKILKISSPPREKGLFRVVYVIDIAASSYLEAAMSAHEIMTDPEAIAPVFDVMDSYGNVTEVDLSKS